MQKQTEEIVSYIKDNINNQTLFEIGKHFNVTKSYISLVIKTYIPELKKENRLFPKKEKRQRLSDLETARRRRFQRKRQHCKTTKQVFTLKYNDIIWPTHCPILGIELDYYADVRAENSVSFDKIIPKLGYIPENTRIVSWRGNRIKNDGTKEEHELIVSYLKKELDSLKEFC